MRIAPRRLIALLRDRSGLAAAEFGLLLPLLLTLFIGSFETGNLLLAYLKTEQAAEMAADLVAQTGPNYALQSSDFTNITNAIDQAMAPLPTSGLEIAFASITFSTGTPVIDWHTEVNGATPITISNLPNGANASTMGSATSGSTDSVIAVQLTYPYVSPVSYVLKTNWTLTESAFNRPRFVHCVPSAATTTSDAVISTSQPTNSCP
jgi:Flp pilus assembly protein TadG